MRFFHLCIHLLLLITTPTLLATPPSTSIAKNQPKKLNKHFKKEKRYHLATYDEFLHLLKEVESGKAEKKYRSKDLKRINKYLAYLAEKGMTPGVTETITLQSDIACLLGTHKHLSDYEVCFIENLEVIAAKGWFSSGWKNTKKFAKKHKKAIIIGAVIVVATAAIVISVGTAAPGAASAVAGAAGAGASSIATDHSQVTNIETPTEPNLEGNITEQANTFKEALATHHLFEPTSIDSLSLEETGQFIGPIFANEAPMVKTTIDKHFASFREFLIEDEATQQTAPSKNWDEMSFGEKAREVGSSFAHDVLDEVTDLARVVPELCEEIKEIGSKLLPDNLAPSSDLEPACPTENYENLVAKGHEIIDNVFSTDQADSFSPQAKTNNVSNEFTLGLLPPPGAVFKTFSNTSKFIRAGKAVDRAGYTKAGRSLMKHGYREGSAFPKPLGNPSQVNAHGQQVLESIINHPEHMIYERPHPDFGKVIEIVVPDKWGARFTIEGEMLGFLEP